MPDGSATAHLYWPKLATVLREGYSFAEFRQDIIAALTVAIVALPLSMAIAIASGVSPARGLYTAIVGGCLVSLLSGSRYQIGGPAGAFIVLVAATVTHFGIEGLLLTVFLSGAMLTLLGLLRLGSLIRHIPHSVIVGFTCGIALTILSSQLRDFGGLHFATAEPDAFFPKLGAVVSAFPTFSPAALAMGLSSVVVIFLVKRFLPNWPGMFIAVIAASAIAALFHLPVETIGSRFGTLPQGLPTPRLPSVSLPLLLQLLPSALTFTLLGGVESLLSAKVADGMTGRKHRSNMELIAQGIANIGSALFGGICVTGTIARTATNVRAGARSPVSGILHSAFLLLFIIAAASLASFVPLCALSGLLVTVCWNMVEKDELGRLLMHWRSGSVLIATLALTLVENLAIGIIAGCTLAALLAIVWPRPGSPSAAAPESHNPL